MMIEKEEIIEESGKKSKGSSHHTVSNTPSFSYFDFSVYSINPSLYNISKFSDACLDDRPPDIFGILSKEGQIFKTWKVRFFALVKGILLYYSQSSLDLAAIEETIKGNRDPEVMKRIKGLKGWLDTGEYAVVNMTPKKIILKLKKGRKGTRKTLLLIIKDSSEYNKWFNSLRAHSEYYLLPTQSDSADLGKINFIESHLSVSAKPPDTLKGYGWKRRPYWYSRWRRRYIVVHQGTLSWGLSPDKLNKSIVLKSYTMSTPDTPPYGLKLSGTEPSPFHILFMWKEEDIETGRNSIISTVSSADSGARGWITCISEHIAYANSKYC